MIHFINELSKDILFVIFTENIKSFSRIMSSLESIRSPQETPSVILNVSVNYLINMMSRHQANYYRPDMTIYLITMMLYREEVYITR